jgi:HSP20 family protein
MSMPKHLIQALPADLSEQLREQLRRLLAHFDELRMVPPFPGAWLPALDLCELNDAIIIRIELPGVARENIRLSLFDNTLKIEGRKQRLAEGDDSEGKPLRYLCLERSNGKFERTVVLQWPVEVEKITANLREGILEVRLPKTIACGREVQIPISN